MSPGKSESGLIVRIISWIGVFLGTLILLAAIGAPVYFIHKRGCDSTDDLNEDEITLNGVNLPSHVIRMRSILENTLVFPQKDEFDHHPL